MDMPDNVQKCRGKESPLSFSSSTLIPRSIIHARATNSRPTTHSLTKEIPLASVSTADESFSVSGTVHEFNDNKPSVSKEVSHKSVVSKPSIRVLRTIGKKQRNEYGNCPLKKQQSAAAILYGPTSNREKHKESSSNEDSNSFVPPIVMGRRRGVDHCYWSKCPTTMSSMERELSTEDFSDYLNCTNSSSVKTGDSDDHESTTTPVPSSLDHDTLSNERAVDEIRERLKDRKDAQKYFEPYHGDPSGNHSELQFDRPSPQTRASLHSRQTMEPQTFRPSHFLPCEKVTTKHETLHRTVSSKRPSNERARLSLPLSQFVVVKRSNNNSCIGSTANKHEENANLATFDCSAIGNASTETRPKTHPDFRNWWHIRHYTSVQRVDLSESDRNLFDTTADEEVQTSSTMNRPKIERSDAASRHLERMTPMMTPSGRRRRDVKHNSIAATSA